VLCDNQSAVHSPSDRKPGGQSGAQHFLQFLRRERRPLSQRDERGRFSDHVRDRRGQALLHIGMHRHPSSAQFRFMLVAAADAMSAGGRLG